MNNLSLIATPIGNLDDLSFRAIKTLTESSIVLCEDTRRTGKIFVYINEKYKISNKPRLIRFDDTTENRDIDKFIDLIKNNEHVSVVSDAGTPLINDPGYKLVREILNRHSDIEITHIPGPSAPIMTLILSGMEPDNFMYLGYLPRKDVQRQNLFNDCFKIHSVRPTTFVALETVHRIEKTLNVLKSLFKENITVFVAHELTKMHESTYKGTPSQLIDKCKKLKGEITISFRFS